MYIKLSMYLISTCYIAKHPNNYLKNVNKEGNISLSLSLSLSLTFKGTRHLNHRSKDVKYSIIWHPFLFWFNSATFLYNTNVTLSLIIRGKHFHAGITVLMKASSFKVLL